MNTPVNNYRVGLLLSNSLSVDKYELSVNGEIYVVHFYNTTDDPDKYCDIVITDKDPDELSDIVRQQKESHGPTLVLNKESDPYLERQFSSIFCKAIIKYITIKEITTETLVRIINAELIKHLVINGKLNSGDLFLYKYTRADLIKTLIRESWIILIPFLIILIYLVAKPIINENGGHLSFLCWFTVYEPDCKQDLVEELGLLALLYSVFNFIFYYNYILRIFGNININAFQFRVGRNILNKCLQLSSTTALFASAFIIFKAIFIFREGFRIAAEYGFINIQTIIDTRLWPFKNEFLIVYFLLLDISLWLMVRNYQGAAAASSFPLYSRRQQLTIKDARKSFVISIVFDCLLLFVTYFIFQYLMKEPQDKLAVQLILLQSIYLYINLASIVQGFKYK